MGVSWGVLDGGQFETRKPWLHSPSATQCLICPARIMLQLHAVLYVVRWREGEQSLAARNDREFHTCLIWHARTHVFVIYG